MESQPLPKTDAELMTLVQGGDQSAFAELVDRHSQVALVLARRIVGEIAAEDVTKAAFLDAWRQRGQFRADRGRVRGWLFGIVRDRAIDEMRRRRSRPELAPHDRPHSYAMGRDESELARAALASLPRDEREALELAYFGGLTQAEIAEQLGVPLGTVAERIRLGLKGLEMYLVAAREEPQPVPAEPDTSRSQPLEQPPKVRDSELSDAGT